MANVVSVTFKDGGKAYYFDPGDLEITEGQTLVVETARGVECGRAATGRKEIPDDQVPRALKNIIRVATDEDLKKLEENRKKEVSAFAIATQKIAARGLQMKLVRVEYAFDGSKILFCFTADGRVDFRELVRDLAGAFRTRIELRQIGIRDEARIFGGLGVCGRPFCCSTFIGDFQPVSIKMAKTQRLSLNPVKISGTCGRLMCCLKYEQKAYEDLIKDSPRIGAPVKTPDGTGVIVDVALLTGKVSVRLDSMPDGTPHNYHKRQITAMDGSGYGLNEPDYLGDLDEDMLRELAALEDQPEGELSRPETGGGEQPHRQGGGNRRNPPRNHGQGGGGRQNRTGNQPPQSHGTKNPDFRKQEPGRQPGKKPSGGQNRGRHNRGRRPE